MSDLYLVAHKVRGQPAFDIATKFLDDTETEVIWIIPTSGHRAYPFWDKPLYELGIDQAPDGCWAWGWNAEGSCQGLIPIPAEGWPDHFACNNPTTKRTLGVTILETLGLRKPAEPIKRRV